MADRCARCDWSYPEDILSPMRGGLVNGPVCGICALEMINAVHGTRQTRLRGMAEEFRQDALRWRRKHPNAKPTDIAKGGA